MPTFAIRSEQSTDADGIHAVTAAAFGGAFEADLVDRLRDEGFAVASIVAVDGDAVVGHLLFSRLSIQTSDRLVDAVALAPLAVRPDRQREGIGSALVSYGLDRLRAMGERIVVVVGHPTYYPRFGFSADLALALESAFAGPAMMALELSPGALDGVRGALRYADPFMVQSEVPHDSPHRPEA